MLKGKESEKTEPSLAPGMSDHEKLEQSAASSEVEKGEFTKVTALSYDEVDPS